jgi:hypothetical protein
MGKCGKMGGEIGGNRLLKVGNSREKTKKCK